MPWVTMVVDSSDSKMTGDAVVSPSTAPPRLTEPVDV